MLNWREVVVVDPEPIVVTAEDPQLPFDAAMLGRGDDLHHGAEHRLCAAGEAGMMANMSS